MPALIKDEKQRWLLASTLLNLFLSVAKLAWGWMAGSTIVTADGIHSISDVIGALLIFMAIRYAGHKSARFPMGLNKLEDFAATLGGAGIFVAGYAIVHSVFFENGIRTPEHIGPTLTFMLIIITVQAVFYRAEIKAAARFRSPGIHADAVNWLGDIGAGSVVVIGILGHAFSVPHAQEIAVVVIVLMIFKGGYEVLRDGLLSLLDASADLGTVEMARGIIERHTDVTGIDKLYIRRSGSAFLASISLRVKERNTSRAHQLMDTLEQELHEHIEGLDVITIHYEPEQHPFTKVATLLDDDRKTLSRKFARSPWIRIQEFGHDGNLLQQTEVANPYATEPRGKAVRLAARLIRENVDVLVFDPEAFEEDISMLLDSAGIEVRQGKAPVAEDG